MVVIDRPVQEATPGRAVSFRPAERPTLVPLVGIGAGLALLGATLAQICLRRRAELASDLTTVSAYGQVRLLPGNQADARGRTAPAMSRPAPFS